MWRQYRWRERDSSVSLVHQSHVAFDVSLPLPRRPCPSFSFVPILISHIFPLLLDAFSSLHALSSSWAITLHRLGRDISLSSVSLSLPTFGRCRLQRLGR